MNPQYSKYRRSIFALTVALGALLRTSSAHAQSSDEFEGLPTAESMDDLDLVELIGLGITTVTAQKRLENIQEVPAAVAAIDGDTLSYLRTGGDDIRFLRAKTPSLNIESSFGRTFPRLYIRGLGNTDFDLNASQPVSVLMDGIVLENPVLKGFPIFDVDRVEVLRGPQGTLFGRNTPAGAIKIESRRPDDTLGGYGRLTYGSFNYTGLEAATNVPVIEDVLSTRVSLMYERRDGWVDNTLTGNENAFEGFNDVAGRFQMLFTPVEALRALVSFHAHGLEGSSRVFRGSSLQKGSGDFVDGFSRFEVSQDGQNRQQMTQYGALADIQLDMGMLTLISLTGYDTLDIYSRGDVDGRSDYSDGAFSAESADAIPSLYQLTQELRLATNDWDIVNFQLGFYYFHEELQVDSYNYATAYDATNGFLDSSINGYATQNQITNAYAAFASVTVDVIEELRLAAGVRYSNDAKDFRAQRLVSPLSFLGIGGTDVLRASPRADYVSWNGSVLFTPAQDINVYARAASGFRAPSVQGRLLFADTISQADSEKILSFEAGIKTQLFDNRARINLTGFYFTLDDQQLTAVGGESNTAQLINVDNTLGYGFELDAEVAPTKGLRMSLGLSYNHTEINDENLAVPTCGADPGGNGRLCTVLDPTGPAEGTALIDGNPLPHAPEWIANFLIDYQLNLDARNAIFGFTNWSLRSSESFFLYESEEFRADEMIIGDIRLGYRRDDGRFEVAAYVSNVLDDLTKTGGIDFNNLTSFVNEPRIFGVEARHSF